MSHKISQHHYLFLLVALTLQLVIDPFFSDKAGSDNFRNALSTITLLVAIYVAGVRKKQLALALGLGTFAIWGIWYVIWVEPSYVLAMMSVITQMAFNFLIIGLILANLFQASRVTLNTIFGSIAVYMILGFTFALFYTFLEAFWPGSLYVDLVHQPSGRLDYPDLVYYSFAVQTTLGFGDVTPVSPEARAFTALHAIVGVFYIAILIARFISMFVAGSKISSGSQLELIEEPMNE